MPIADDVSESSSGNGFLPPRGGLRSQRSRAVHIGMVESGQGDVDQPPGLSGSGQRDPGPSATPGHVPGTSPTVTPEAAAFQASMNQMSQDMLNMKNHMAEKDALIKQMVDEMQRQRNNPFGQQGGKGQGHQDAASDKGGMKLDERYFRRMETFSGDIQKYGSWKFDFLVCLGQADRELSRKLNIMMKEVAKKKEVLNDGWHVCDMDLGEGNISREMYDKYSGELYAVLCTLTGGEAKGIIKGLNMVGNHSDGFRAMAEMEKRFEVSTATTVLQAHLEVVSPPSLKPSEIIGGIHKWELKVAVLKERHQETLGPTLKLAILLGMIPKEYSELLIQQGHRGKDKMDYEDSKDWILMVANQRMQMHKPDTYGIRRSRERGRGEHHMPTM